jgi:hypothetical protein
MATFLDNVAAAITSIVSAESIIFQNREPSSPALCLTIYGTGGAPDALDFSGNTNGERPVQFRFRDPSGHNLQLRTEALYDALRAWRAYPAAYLQMKASTKPLYSYPVQSSNSGELFIASFNVTVIAGS